MNDLDSVITRLYVSISFEPGERPDWTMEEEIFAPGARMVRITDAGVFAFDVPAFRRDFERMIDSGQLPSFWEAELWRETRLFGEMAHVLSAYETRQTRNSPVINRGVNSIQLFLQDGRWRISAMIWRRDGRDVTIPESAPAYVSRQ